MGHYNLLEKFHIYSLNLLRDSSKVFTDADELEPILEGAGDSQIVLIGMASYGASEFLELRGEITRRLIEKKGFDFVAVEGDWRECYEVNKYVQNNEGSAVSAEETLSSFKMEPKWIWANQETAYFIHWLREFNDSKPQGRKIGFYGVKIGKIMRNEFAAETIYNLMQDYSKLGRKAKAIIWVHNIHAADSLSMHRDGENRASLGRIERELHPKKISIIGFGFGGGSVMAAKVNGSGIENIQLSSLHEGSWEYNLHRMGGYDRLIVMDANSVLPDESRGHRNFRETCSESGTYFSTILKRAYDFFIYIDKVSPVHPL